MHNVICSQTPNLLYDADADTCMQFRLDYSHSAARFAFEMMQLECRQQLRERDENNGTLIGSIRSCTSLLLARPVTSCFVCAHSLNAPQCNASAGPGQRR
eukprot:2882968-Pleurochrysis_carterae.AAC.1